MRAALGVIVFVQGIHYFVAWRDLELVLWAVGLLAVASGVSLLIGYLTPAGCVLAVFISASGYFSWFQTPSPNLFDTRVAAALAVSIAVGLVCLGPGAFSIDARLFGRHEIIIPEVPHPPEA